MASHNEDIIFTLTDLIYALSKEECSEMTLYICCDRQLDNATVYMKQIKSIVDNLAPLLLHKLRQKLLRRKLHIRFNIITTRIYNLRFLNHHDASAMLCNFDIKLHNLHEVNEEKFKIARDKARTDLLRNLSPEKLDSYLDLFMQKTEHCQAQTDQLVKKILHEMSLSSDVIIELRQK